MKPITTPGKASGKVSIATSTARPGKRLRARKSAAAVPRTSVAAVTDADRRSVAIITSRWRAFVSTVR